MDTLGKRIKSIREKTGMNQSRFAKELGLESAVAISKYESDQREPDMNKMIIISKLGNVSLDWLLTGEERERKNDIVSESRVLYNEEYPALTEIIHMLKDHPQDISLVLKLLRGKSDIKEALEGFEIKKLLNEEGT